MWLAATVAAACVAAGTPSRASTPGVIARFAGGGVGDGQRGTTIAYQGGGTMWPEADGDVLFGDHGRVRRYHRATATVSTIAGSASDGWEATPSEIGDGTPATSARLNGPAGITRDRGGNLYIADTSQNRIRRVDAATGTITTIAGTGEPGFTGDGGDARRAMLGSPYGVAFDSKGNLFVADSANMRVRRIDTAGIITTIAGDGREAPSGDGGAATSAGIGPPFVLAFDRNDNLYVTGSGDTHVIRKVDAAGRISTFAGTGMDGFAGDGGPARWATFSAPIGLWFDERGDLLIADTGNMRLRRVDMATGIIRMIAGNGGYESGDGGPAAAAGLGVVLNVAVDSLGGIVVTTRERIRRIDGSGIISPLVGNGAEYWSGDGSLATNTTFGPVHDVAIDRHGNVYIVDDGNARVRKVGADGRVTTVAGNGTFTYSGDGGPATRAGLPHPQAVAVDRFDNVYVSTIGDARVRKIDASTGVISTIAGNGLDPTICQGSLVLGDGLPATLASLGCPMDIAVDRAGNLYIADVSNNRVRRVDALTGIMTTFAGSTQDKRYGDGLPATAAWLKNPYGVAVDDAGNVYIADSGHWRIRKVDALNGIITTIAGSGAEPAEEDPLMGDDGRALDATFMYPEDVAVSASGVVYVADPRVNRVRAIDASGTVRRIAGPRYGSGGDGGPAVDAELRVPTQIEVAPTGDLYIADLVNERVRVVHPLL